VVVPEFLKAQLTVKPDSLERRHPLNSHQPILYTQSRRVQVLLFLAFKREGGMGLVCPKADRGVLVAISCIFAV
jgi:hypothetical protein